MEMKELILKLAVKHFDVPGFVGEVISGPVDMALDKLVKDTELPFDDMMKAALFPVLVAEINKLMKAEWEKLVAQESVA